MPSAERALKDALRQRNQAKQRFMGDIDQVRADVAARGVGGRISDKAVATGADVIEEAVEIANANRGVIAGTIAALGLWLFRNPLIAFAGQLADRIRKLTR